MGTTVYVSDPTKEALDELKEREQHTSYDSAIRALLHAYDDEQD